MLLCENIYLSGINMATLKKQESWAVRISESSSDGDTVVVGEMEEERVNSAYAIEDPTKAKTTFMVRIAPSTSGNTANSNIETQKSAGADYGHVSNTFISGPANQTSNAISKIRTDIRRSHSEANHVTSRGRSRGKN